MTQENGLGMFKVEPHYDFNRIPVELPTCMFKMASYHGQPEDNQVDPKLVELERRQLHILQELKSLENEVASLAVKFKPAADAPVLCTKQKAMDLGEVIHDIVIYANPSQPPFSLCVLYEMLKLHYRCRCAIHVHSSVRSLPDKLLGCFGNGVELSRGEAQISLTLIWKDVSHGPIMMVAAPSQAPIHGEANIARYIARLLNPGYDGAADIAQATSTDNWLDLATGAMLNGNSKEKAAAIRSLNSRLGKHDWLVGPSVSMADITCWSAVYSTGLAASAPANVQKWLKACATQSIFKLATGLIGTSN